MSPELVSRKPYDRRVDTWAVGALTYILMTGRPPFPGSTEEQRNSNIKKNNPDYSKLVGISKVAQDFIRKCLNSDIQKRPHIDEMLKHPWIEKIEEMDLSQEVQLDIAKNICSF
jgi:serine/threonine protein kinase